VGFSRLGRGLIGALALLGLLERDEESWRFVAAVRSGLRVDLAGEHVLDERLRECLHLEELALWRCVGDLVGLSLTESGRRCVRSMTITSHAATRPPPIFAGSRWLTTPRSTRRGWRG